MSKLRLKKGDTVLVISGKGKGKRGTIVLSNPEKSTVTLDGGTYDDGINQATCHTKPKRQGEVGGIVKKELAIRSCKVMLVCKACDKATRIGYKIDGENKVRVCKHCNKEV